MYHYVEDKVFLSRMRSLCGDIMQKLCHVLKEEFDIGAQFYLVGSGKKKLILQNESEPVDLDYNLEIVRLDDIDIKDCRNIKECVRKAFNKTLHTFNWSDCEDSTSSLTTEKRYFTKGNNTCFSMDVCIVKKDKNGNTCRLIHEKTGYTKRDRYYWNLTPNSKNVKNKVRYIKGKGRWKDIENQYIKLKNMYLIRNDHNHPSFICYIEAVNNVYNSLKR